ncbi:hypothetical protein T484DRAFT_1841889, partial [Baffinella frigidus]
VVPPTATNPLTPGTLTFTYNDALPAANSQAVVLKGGFLGSLATTFNVLNAGGSLRVVLQDIDLNLAPNTPNMVTGVLVTSAMTNQYEMLTLTENGGDTGVFTGVLHTSVDPTRGFDFTGDMHVFDFTGDMHVQPGDLLNVRYNDVSPATPVERGVRIATEAMLTRSPLLFFMGGVAARVLTRSPLLLFVGGSVTITVAALVLTRSPLLLFVGGSVTITVADMDMDRDVHVADTIASALVTLTKGTVIKQLLLTETGPSTGIFTGAVTLTAGVMGASTFGPVVPGDLLTVTYHDPMPLNGISMVLPIFERGVITTSPSPWVEIGAEIVTVVDADMNRDPLVVEVMDQDSKLVWMQLNRIDNLTITDLVDREFVEVVETGADTGVFTGAFTTSNSQAASFDSGVLSPVVISFAMIAHYLDTSPIQTSTFPTYPGFAPTDFQVLPAALGAGGKITITLKDGDLNLDGYSAESVDVTVGTDRIREPVETVTLRETGVNTGVFTGTIQTVKSAAFSEAGDGLLYGSSGGCDATCCSGFLVTTYPDVRPRADIKRYTSLGTKGTIDACWPSSRYTDMCTFQTGSVRATITDPDLNINPAAKEVHAGLVSVTAQFWSHISNSLVTSQKVFIPIAETGLNTGVFTGDMSTLTSAQSGVLQVFDNADIKKASTVVTMVYESAKSEYPTATTRLKTDAPSEPLEAHRAETALDGTSILPVGQDLVITVMDGDMDYQRYAPDTVDILIWAGSQSAGASGIRDEQLWTLTETGNSTGVFTGSVPTEMATPICDDSVIQVYQEAGAMVKATYSELAPDGTIITNPTLTAKWPGSIYAHSDDYEALSANLIGLTEASCGVFTLRYLSANVIGLTEASCGVFTGTYTVAADFGAPNGTKRSFIYANYADASHGGQVRTTTIRVSPIPLVFIGAFADSISAVSVTVSVTVLDSAADSSDYPDTTLVSVSTFVGGMTAAHEEYETLTVTETGGASGTFTAHEAYETLTVTERGGASGTFTGLLPIRVATERSLMDGTLDGDIAGLANVADPVVTLTYGMVSTSQDI